MNESLGVFNLVLLAVPGIALKIAVRIMYGRRSFVAADPLKVLLTVSSTVLLVLAGVGFLGGLAGPTSSPAALLITWVPALVIIAVIVLMSIDSYRRGEHRALVWTLAAAAKCGVPLPEAARAFADETQDDTGARALVLAQSLEQGMPLSSAATTARLRMATPMRVAVRVGEALGMLGPAMRQQLEDSTDADSTMRTVISRLYYLWAVVLILTSVITFVMLRIVPVFQKMFQEFGLELPAMTASLINVARSPTTALTSIPLLGLPFVILGFVVSLLVAQDVLSPGPHVAKPPSGIPERFNRRFVLRIVGTMVLLAFIAVALWRPIEALRVAFQMSLFVCWIVGVAIFSIGGLLYLVGLFPRGMPGIWRLLKRYDGALVMRGLALAVRRELPIAQAFQLLSETYPVRPVGHLLAGVTAKASQGLSWQTSLASTGLISRADAAVLTAAQRAGNLPWALEEMADSAIRRQTYRLQLALHCLYPVAVLILGVAVAFFVIGLFLPLISLIQGLS
jgi:type II secretory pathway component PulF